MLGIVMLDKFMFYFSYIQHTTDILTMVAISKKNHYFEGDEILLSPFVINTYKLNGREDLFWFTTLYRNSTC